MRMQLSVLALSLLLGGCMNLNQTKPHDEDPSIQLAQGYMQSKDYGSAIRVLEQFRSEHPLSPNIPSVEKLLIECYFEVSDYPMLQASTDRFLFEHHEDPNRDYIAYLRFDSIAHQAKGYPYTWLPIDRASRDVSRVKEAFIAGKTFLRDYPKSAYAPNVAHEMPPLKETIARHYFLQGNMLSYRVEPIGAIRSYQYILSDLKDTSYAEPAQKALDEFRNAYALSRTISLNSAAPVPARAADHTDLTPVVLDPNSPDIL